MIRTYIKVKNKPMEQPSVKRLSNLSILSYFDIRININAPIINLDGPSRAFTINGPLIN